MLILDNEMRVIFKPTKANTILGIVCLIDIGSSYEPMEKIGITNFTQTLLLKGTEKRSAEDIALELESIGASMGTSTHEDYAELTAVATVQDAEKIIEIMSDVLFHASFPPEEVEKERKNILAGIRLSEDNKFYYTYKHFRRLLYGETHPYGHPVEGEPETVKRISRADILKHYRRYYHPSNMILSVVGNIEEENLVSLLRRYLPGKATKRVPKVTADKSLRRKSAIEVKTKEIEQGFIILGYNTCDVRSPDYVPLKVASTILGEGMSSRLFVNLRDKLGLAYNVGCGMPSRRLRSHLFAWIGTKPESIQQAKEQLLAEFERLKTEKVSDEELTRAKKYIIGRFLLDHQTNLRQAWYLGWYEMLRLGYHFDEKYPELVEKVTAEDIMRVARRYFNHPAIEILQPASVNISTK